jgi:hypothetical protein
MAVAVEENTDALIAVARILLRRLRPHESVGRPWCNRGRRGRLSATAGTEPVPAMPYAGGSILSDGLARSTVTSAKRSESPMTGPLSDEDFAHIVGLVPLVSIDLIIRDANGNVLVALRTNEPAKGVYFVPGGRIMAT